MGLAQLPRIYFNGFTYWNPSTMNNNDYQPTYDPATATLNWPWLERHGLQSPDNFDAYVTQPSIVATANSATDPFVDNKVPPAEWNFYGDNACGFVQPDEPVLEMPSRFTKPAGSLCVTGYTNGSGSIVTSGDPWIGQPLRMNAGMAAARLVDVDPICPWSSQIFVNALSLGSDTLGTGFTAQTAGRAHSRWVFFKRNLHTSNDVILAGVGGATFQLALPAADITLFDGAPVAGSLASQVRTALGQPGAQGLMVRFQEYLTVYFSGPVFSNVGSPASNWKPICDLYAAYAEQLEGYRSGKLASPPPMPVNRAYSKTVGWIAPWMQGELRSMPGGRTLHSPGGIQPVDPKLTPTPVGPAVVEYVVNTNDPTMVSRITIDLGATIPELDSAATKVNFGTMLLGLSPLGQPVVPVIFAEVPFAGGYDRTAYEATAGVIDIPASSFLAPVSVASLQDSAFVVSFAASLPGNPAIALLETPYTAETDDRAVYVQQPNAPWTPSQAGSYSIDIQVRYLGGKPPQGTELGIVQYAPNPPVIGENGWRLVSTAPASQSQSPYVELITGTAVTQGAYSVVPVPYADDGLPYSVVSTAVRGIRSGPPVVEFHPLAPSAVRTAWMPDDTVPFPNVTQKFFANVRVLPYHNEVALDFENWLRTGPSVDLVSQRVFDTVFRTFFLMYPVMRFLRDPLQFQASRGRICRVTDPAIFEHASYMPVMRSMSAGQRRILELWNTYLDGQVPTQKSHGPLMRRG